jgi:hypothetical protein
MTRRVLTDQVGRFVGRTERLRGLFSIALPSNVGQAGICSPLHEKGRLFMLVSLTALWGEFCRELIVRSALGAITMSGQRIPAAPGLRSLSDAKLVTPLSGPGVNWYLPHDALNRAQHLNIFNYGQVSSGLSSISIDEIVSVRNFVVHPNEHTRSRYLQAAANLGFAHFEPDQLLHARLVGGSILFEQWIDDFQTAAINAAR